MRFTFLVILTLTVVYWFPVRRWFGRWGTTDEDLTRVMAGDAVIANPTHSATHAVTVAEVYVVAHAPHPAHEDRLQAAHRISIAAARSIGGSRSVHAVPGEALKPAILSAASDGMIVSKSP